MVVHQKLYVEVVSPSDDADDLQLKISQYLRCGMLDGGDVLPGFSLAVGDIFPA